MLKPLLNVKMEFEERDSDSYILCIYGWQWFFHRPQVEVMLLRYHSAQVVASGILYRSHKFSENLMCLYYESSNLLRFVHS